MSAGIEVVVETRGRIGGDRTIPAGSFTMRSMKLLLPALILVLAVGCQTGWVRQDGGAVDATRLEQARSACDVERQLAALERAREDRDRGLQQANTNQGKMLAREDFAAVEQRVEREIEACMRQQGYARQG